MVCSILVNAISQEPLNSVINFVKSGTNLHLNLWMN